MRGWIAAAALAALVGVYGYGRATGHASGEAQVEARLAQAKAKTDARLAAQAKALAAMSADLQAAREKSDTILAEYENELRQMDDANRCILGPDSLHRLEGLFQRLDPGTP